MFQALELYCHVDKLLEQSYHNFDPQACRWFSVAIGGCALTVATSKKQLGNSHTPLKYQRVYRESSLVPGQQQCLRMLPNTLNIVEKQLCKLQQGYRGKEGKAMHAKFIVFKEYVAGNFIYITLCELWLLLETLRLILFLSGNAFCSLILV